MRTYRTPEEDPEQDPPPPPPKPPVGGGGGPVLPPRDLWHDKESNDLHERINQSNAVYFGYY